MVTNATKPCILPLLSGGKERLEGTTVNGILKIAFSLKQGFPFEVEIHRFCSGKLQTIIRQFPGFPDNNDIKTYFLFNIIARKRFDNIMTLLERIHKLAQNNNLSKHEQLVQGVIEAIDMELLKVGDKLPSINAMVRDLGFARKTIVKAYEELKQRGLIESKKLKGYFIISKETNTMLKVALLLFSFQRFQEEFYNAFRNTLGEAYQIDVFFHHNNITLFETIFNNIKGKYGMYVVAPIPHPSTLPLLNSIEPSKLLIIDRYLKMDEAYAYVSQEFRKSTYDNLLTLLPSIKKYKKFVLFFNDGDCPVEILRAYEEFIANFSLAGEVRRTYRAETIEKDNLYFFISDTFLWEVLKDCQSRGYVLGRDVGILSHNDHIVKQIVCGGITTISTDFNRMAVKAAEYVMNGRVVHTILPLKLIDRGSL